MSDAAARACRLWRLRSEWTRCRVCGGIFYHQRGAGVRICPICGEVHTAEVAWQ